MSAFDARAVTADQWREALDEGIVHHGIMTIARGGIQLVRRTTAPNRLYRQILRPAHPTFVAALEIGRWT